jgi:nucleoside-diphosphate-sugar epimerase
MKRPLRLMITGNMGYVGPIVVRHLRRVFPDAVLVGLDSGLFAHCLTTTTSLPETLLDEQRFVDIRDVITADLAGFDAVVHLAGISNDPIGSRFESVTEEINFRASVRLAKIASEAKVRNFVFASSCSIYGSVENGPPRVETDPLNPLTAYARSKIATENGVAQMDCQGMVVTCLRFATACGMSDRLRLDLVINDFVANAVATGEIAVLSDGTPWRPLIDVRDMARAIEWAIERDASNGGEFLSINVGADRGNYNVSELAAAVARAIPSTKVSINLAAPPDKRSYRVNFGLFAKLAPQHQPRVTIDQSIAMVHEGLGNFGFNDRNFRESQLIRLRVLERLVAEGGLSKDLRWAVREARTAIAAH